jgi:hypothetical protein
VLQENRGNGKNMEHMGGCPSFISKADHPREPLPGIEAKIGPGYWTCEKVVDTRPSPYGAVNRGTE